MTGVSEDRSEDGVTLVELLISVMILGIVVAAIFGAMSTLTNNERRAQNRVQTQEETRTALTEMARELRSATLIDTPATTTVARTTVSFTRADTKKGRWTLDPSAGTLTREVGTVSGSVTTWSVVRTYTNIRNGSTTPLLQYYGSGNQRLDLISTATPVDLASCTLRIRLTLKGSFPDAPTTYTVSLDVSLRNHGSRGVSGC